MSDTQQDLSRPPLEVEEQEPETPPAGPSSAYGVALDPKPIGVEIFAQWCKGCELCVFFCPKDCLAMSPYGKAIEVNPEACIQCALCWVHCPDFAIVSKVK